MNFLIILGNVTITYKHVQQNGNSVYYIYVWLMLLGFLLIYGVRHPKYLYLHEVFLKFNKFQKAKYLGMRDDVHLFASSDSQVTVSDNMMLGSKIISDVDFKLINTKGGYYALSSDMSLIDLMLYYRRYSLVMSVMGISIVVLFILIFLR